MLATAKLPQSFIAWNAEYGAPFGRPPSLLRWKRRLMTNEAIEKFAGPFAIQPNNTTRTFEYPWAFSAADIKPQLKVVEIGGGLSGFQFALSKAGCNVLNIDPGLAAEGVGWLCDQESMAKLNNRFATNVELLNTTIEHANLQPNSIDRVFSISVIEHLPPHEVVDVMAKVLQALKPGGLFVLTVDLFLNLTPFTDRETNEFGRNQNVRELISAGDWELAVGDPRELYGFAEFDSNMIQRNLETFMIGQFYPALVQCVVFRKRK